MTSSSLAPRPIDRDASGAPSRRRPRSRHRRLSVPAAVLLGVPLLAACGADDTAAVDPAAVASGAEAGQQAPGRDGAGFPGASGVVADVSGSTAQVQGSTGQVAVSWTGATTFTREVTGSLDDVAVGSCVVAALEDDVAVSLRVTEASGDGCTGGLAGGFGGAGRGGAGVPPEDAGPSGAPEGERREGGPGGVGGGAVVGEVTAVAGATVTVAAVEPGSGAGEGEETTVEQVLSVDADTEVVATVSATADDVAEGSCLTARGEADDLGAVTADSVALSEPVDGSCATGRGGPGGGRGPGAGIAEDAQGDA